jgi:hypothetical protein
LIRERLIKLVYNNISAGLLKSHRIILAIILVKALFPQEITDNLYDILLGNVVIDSKAQIPRWLDQNEKEQFLMFISSYKGNNLNMSDTRW